tara:strand:- start:216 stop:380 length:165 start_codon:yes stop_codon:yes gene_type:complete
MLPPTITINLFSSISFIAHGNKLIFIYNFYIFSEVGGKEKGKVGIRGKGKGKGR